MPSALAGHDSPFVLVVGLDLADTESSGFALDQAAHLAMRIANSNMHLIYVLPADTEQAKVRQAAGLLKLYINEKANLLGGLAQMNVGVHVRRGDAAKEIAQLASEVHADAILVGAHEKLRSLVLGTTSERLMKAAQCPVLVAGPRPHPAARHIITIEPPCPDCTDVRFQTQGKTWWCARHSEHHLRAHRYSYQSELPFAEHDSEAIPTGTD